MSCLVFSLVVVLVVPMVLVAGDDIPLMGEDYNALTAVYSALGLRAHFCVFFFFFFFFSRSLPDNTLHCIQEWVRFRSVISKNA
jgi:hypothetical protein